MKPLLPVILITTSLGLSACVQKPISDIVVYKGPSYTVPNKSMITKKNPFKVTVQAGDTLYSIAREYNVSLRPLIERNRLYPPYKLYPGQEIKIPKAQFHVVKEGDTLYSVSRGYDVNLHQLAEENNLSEPYYLLEGTRLKLPAKNSYQYASTISEDDTINLDEEPLEEDIPSLASAPTQAESSHNVQAREISSLEPATPKAKPSQAQPFKQRKVTSYKSKGPVKFVWPSRGKVISGFGPKKGGLYNDGINIAAPDGAPIKAAEEGKIVYAGNELRGYGNLVLIKHKNGYLTAYAHARRLLVKKGDFVRKGDIIGEVGKTGHVDKPQLHFSIRKGRKALNPKKYLS